MSTKLLSISPLGLLNSSTFLNTNVHELYGQLLDDSVAALEAIYEALSKDIDAVDRDANLSTLGKAVQRRALAVTARRLAAETSTKFRRKPTVNLNEATLAIKPDPLHGIAAVDVVTELRRQRIIDALLRMDVLLRFEELKAATKAGRMEPIRAVASLGETFMRRQVVGDAEWEELSDLFTAIAYESETLQVAMANACLDVLNSNQATIDHTICKSGNLYPGEELE